MADLNAWEPGAARAGGCGPLSKLGRAQYAALMRMRLQALSHSMRTTRGAFEIGARIVTYLVYGGMGMGLAIGATVAAYELTLTASWGALPVVMWVAFFLWQAIPVVLASMQEQYDLSLLLRFPVSFGSYYALTVVFGLADISTIIGVLCVLGLWLGMTTASPALALWAAAAYLLFTAFNVLLVRVVLAWVDRWLAQRRTREIVSAVFLAVMLSLQLLNPALRGDNGRRGRDSFWPQMIQRLNPWAEEVNAAQGWLPPGLAARALADGAQGQTMQALGSLGLLGIWVLGAGTLLGFRVRAEYRGEELSEAPARHEARQARRGWLLDGSGPIAAVLEKELRTVLRSMPLIYAMGAPVFMVIIIGSLMRSGPQHTGHTVALALPMCVGYALLGTSQIAYNNLGGEGTGIQLLFFSPTPIRTVLLAKNIFHAGAFIVVAFFAALLAFLRLGAPSTEMMIATAAWLVFALPANLAAGNLFSILMPHRMNLGRIKRQKVSAGNALLSLLAQAVLLAIGGGVFAIGLLEHDLWISTGIFAVLAVVAVLVWRRVLRLAETMAYQRRDTLIATLARAE
jgi:ABC-2 type transport system permease protein